MSDDPVSDRKLVRRLAIALRVLGVLAAAGITFVFGAIGMGAAAMWIAGAGLGAVAGAALFMLAAWVAGLAGG